MSCISRTLSLALTLSYMLSSEGFRLKNGRKQKGSNISLSMLDVESEAGCNVNKANLVLGKVGGESCDQVCKKAGFKCMFTFTKCIGNDQKKAFAKAGKTCRNVKMASSNKQYAPYVSTKSQSTCYVHPEKDVYAQGCRAAKAGLIRLCTCSKDAPVDPGTPLSTLRAAVFKLVNEERAKVGSPKLCYNTKLMKAARDHSDDQARMGRMSHRGSDGSDVATRLRRVGYPISSKGENVAMSEGPQFRSPTNVMRHWMGSPGHRHNILKSDYKNIGLGLTLKNNNYYWTQVFGRPTSGSGCDFKSRGSEDISLARFDNGTELGTALFMDSEDGVETEGFVMAKGNEEEVTDEEEGIESEEAVLLGAKPGYCNVCRDPRRSLANPDHKFRMQGKVWTCRYLQETVQDVNPSNPSEARWCTLNQYIAEKECKCNGPKIPPLDSNVRNPNPKCDLCPRGVYDYDYVPGIQEDQLVDTGSWGRHSCGGLYKALGMGVWSKDNCPKVRAKAGAFCCNLPKLNKPR